MAKKTKRIHRSCRHCHQLLAPGLEFAEGEHQKCPNTALLLPYPERDLISQRSRYRKRLIVRTRDEWIAATGPMGFTTFSSLSPGGDFWSVAHPLFRRLSP